MVTQSAATTVAERVVEVGGVLVVVVVLAALLAGALVVQGRLRAGGAGHGPRQAWAVATGTTRDGVTAHVQVEYAWEAVGTARDDALEARVAGAVEDALQQLVAERTVSALPGLGDDPGWDPQQFVDGARVEHVRVTISEVEVTSELRRLVQDRGTG